MHELDAVQEDDANVGQTLEVTLWYQLWNYARQYPRDLFALGFCAAVTAAMEISYPLITRSVIDAVATDSSMSLDTSPSSADFTLIWQYAWLYLLTTVIITLSIGGFIRIGGKLETQISYDIRRDGFANLQALSFSYFNRRPVGWLMARMTADCERLSNILVWGFLDAIWGGTMMIGITIAMFWLHPMLATVVMCVMPLVAVASVFFHRRLLASARAATSINSRITASYNEAITGVLTSKVFVREAANLEEFGGLTARLAQAKIRNVTYASIYLPIVVTLASLAIGMTLVFGGIEVLGGVISVGTLIAFMSFASNIFEPVEKVSERFAEMQMAQASAERILGLINELPAIQDSAELYVPENDTTPITQVQLKEVCFSYENGQSILQGVNLDAKVGDSVAIVGPTGGGKSTLVNVLARFYEPSSGSVLINGIDYRRYSQYWLQSRLGVVLQDNHIFSGTLMDNIRYGHLDATDAQIIEASQLAGAHEYIMSFEGGYYTEAGEGGNRLSAGQKQLISLARAFVADPQILIMDEATSFVDTQTEQKIQQGLAELLKGRTGFIIAHRLSTIRQADLIVFIDEGKIVEQGTHTELMGKGGSYRTLYELQQLEHSAQSQYS